MFSYFTLYYCLKYEMNYYGEWDIINTNKKFKKRYKKQKIKGIICEMILWYMKTLNFNILRKKH